jgi:hypothetical protein
VLVFSASAYASPQVRREVERAVHKGVSLLPVRIEDVLPSKSLEYFLSTQHWTHWTRVPHREALRASCIDELPLTLGDEIESESDRRQCIETCRQSERPAH